MDNIIIQVLVAGIGIAISAAILGCFVVWRKMAYFADSLAHSSLLGIAIGLSYGVNLNIAVLVVALVFAVLLLILESKKIWKSDSLLGVLSYGFLAFAIIILTALDLDIDLHAYLFGDILAISMMDIYFIYTMLILISLFIFTNWHKLLLITISEDLALAEHIKVILFKILFMLILALFVVLSVQLIGALLIGALLIIPVVSSRMFSNSMGFMMLLSIIIATFSTMVGVWISFQLDTPTGPSIVAISAVLFLLFFILNLFKNTKKK